MKKFLTIVFAILISGSVLQLMAQVSPDDPNYQQMKESGQITQPDQALPPVAPISTIKQMENGNRNAGLLIPRDASFTLAMAPNDDGSSNLITLPFTFCLFGDEYTSCYINNNGNVTFDNPLAIWSSTGFPYPSYPMLAPFWADVDTRGCGSVWYKIETNPNRMIVIWEEVGYFSIQCDKVNTFELILTDGNDPFIGVGKNVAFSFADMSWTTGSASGGTGGYFGIPATVGINKGDGIDYALVGLFDHPGADYDGAGGNNDGVDYLDEKDFAFDACAGEIVLTPVSDWALFLGIGLILVFAIFRLRRLV